MDKTVVVVTLLSTMLCYKVFLQILRIHCRSSTGHNGPPFISFPFSLKCRYCGGQFNPVHNSLEDEVVIAPILSTLFTVDVRAGDPELFPAENSSGVPINPPFNPTHHKPGFNISFEQIFESCPHFSTNILNLRFK